ncbi:hypothetical protein ES707_12164 [subsurface metagenome]
MTWGGVVAIVFVLAVVSLIEGAVAALLKLWKWDKKERP